MRDLMPFIISFVLTALLTPIIIHLAPRLGWITKPRADRWSSRPTALMGGIAIFLGAAISWGVLPTGRAMTGIAIAAAAMFVLGFVDDRLNLRPHLKLIGQLAATAALIVWGVKFTIFPPIISLPLTFLWIIGITNAVNLLDNMDGLAAGVSMISALTMALYFASIGDAAMIPAVLALAGACAGFLLFNFNPAKIFMGDCGSMFLGFSLAALSVEGLHRTAPNLMLSLLVPVALMAVPIFDTTLVSVSRTLNGRRISQGGRDHSSHRLVSLGLSERGTVLVLYALTALFGGVALLATQLSLTVAILTAGLLLVGLLLLGLYLGLLKVYGDDAPIPAHVRLIKGTFLYKKQMLQVMLDFVLVPLAFIGAHLLRFEGSLYADAREAVFAALPVVLAAKLVSLALCRAYRGMWRYAGMVDAISAVAGSTLGSLVAALLISVLFGFKGISRAALIVDWALFSILVVSTRTGFVALRQLFGMLPPPDGPRVLILGFGSEAMGLISRLRDPHSSRRAHVLGILDDDPAKQQRLLNGIPVLGPIEELPGILNDREINCCLLGVPPQSELGLTIVDLCHRNKIVVYRDLDTPLFPASA